MPNTRRRFATEERLQDEFNDGWGIILPQSTSPSASLAYAQGLCWDAT